MTDFLESEEKSSIEAGFLVKNLSNSLRLKISSPPSSEPEKQKNYAYVIKSLIREDFSDEQIIIILKSFPIGQDRSDIRKDLAKFRDSDPGEEKISQNFVNIFKDSVRYCHEWEKWLIFNGSFWEEDKKLEIINKIRLVVRDTEMPSFKKRASTIRGIEFILTSDPELATKSSDWDKDPWLLACLRGTIDLKTGRLRLSYPQELITKSCSVSPEPGIPVLWLKFLDQATQGNQELISYLQRMCGYCLTGSIKEESLFFLYGDGGNGKGVFLSTISNILGDYSVVAPMETFVENKFSNNHPTELAMLRGARLVTAQETEEGKYWNESRIKALTGGDMITARFMHKDFFTFYPVFKLLISGNHEPNLKTVDNAIRRRFNKLPFIFKPDPPNLNLKEELKSEYPQILSWMLEGCKLWQEKGLNPPNIVIEATNKFYENQDLFPQWIEEKLIKDKSLPGVLYDTLQDSWFSFAKANHQRQGDARMFKARMEKIEEIEYSRTIKIPGSNPARYGRGYKGVKLKL